MSWSLILTHLVDLGCGTWDQVLDMSYEQIHFAFEAASKMKADATPETRRPKPGCVNINSDEQLQRYLKDNPC